MSFINRLMLIVGVVIVAFAGVSVVGTQIVRQSQSIDELSTELERLSSDTWHLQSLTFEMRLTSDFFVVIPEWRSVASGLQERLTTIVEMPQTARMGQRSEELADTLGRMSSLVQLVQREINDYEQLLSEFTNGFEEYPSFSLSRLLSDDSGNFAALRVRSGGETLAAYLDQTLQTLITRTVEQLDEERAQVIRLLLGIFFVVAGLTTVAVVLVILSFGRALRSRFGAIRASMEQLAAGDLSVRIERTGRDEVSELSRHVQGSIDEFAGVVGTIKEIARAAGSLRSDVMAATEESSASVTQIGGNISSITSTIEDLDRTIEETGSKLDDIHSSIRALEQQIENQTRAVEESSSAVEQMTASVTSVSRIAADRQEAAESLKRVTEEGHANIEETDEKVTAIADSVDETLGIITVINTIASQTSILSMNAAIEAAHAGEYGKGFAVVAAEIRRLSESTNENAKRIKEQLQRVAELATDTRQMSATTRESFLSVESEVSSTATALNEISATMRELSEGTESVLEATTQAGQITQGIRSDATKVAAKSDEITGDMHHVREISTSVRGGIQEIGVGTREINEMVSGLTSVTRQLADQVDLLGESVSRFRTDTGDGSAGDQGAGGESAGDGSAGEAAGDDGTSDAAALVRE